MICLAVVACSSSSDSNPQQGSPDRHTAEAVKGAYFNSRMAETCARRHADRGSVVEETRRFQSIRRGASSDIRDVLNEAETKWLEFAARAEWACPEGDALARFREANEELLRTLSNR